MENLEVLVVEHPDEIASVFKKWKIQKPVDSISLKSAIILYKEPFVMDLFNELASGYDSFLGIRLKADPEKKAARQAKRQAKKQERKEKKALKAGAEGATSGWNKFKGYVSEGLGIGDAVNNLFSQDKIEKEELEKEEKSFMMWIIIAVVIIIILLVLFFVLKKN